LGLRAALAVETGNRSLTIEIGGPDRVSYGDLMREYARQRGLRRLMIPVPLGLFSTESAAPQLF